MTFPCTDANGNVYKYSTCVRCGEYLRVYETGMQLHYPPGSDKLCLDDKENEIAQDRSSYSVC